MSTKPIVEGGLLTAISVILGLASIYVPVFGTLIEFFCAVPIVLLTVRQGFAKGCLSLMASFILLTMFVGPILSLRIALSFGICGLVMGLCVAKGFNTLKCFFTTLIAATLSQILAISILTFAMGIDVMGSETASIEEMFETSFEMYSTMGVSAETISEWRTQVEPTIKLMQVLMPMIIFLMALVNTAACYLTAQWIFKRLNMKFLTPMPEFANWRFPIVILYLSAFAMIGLYWSTTRNWSTLYSVSVNATFLTMGVAFIQGLSVLSFFADKFNISKILRRIAFVLIIFSMFAIELVTFTGLFDMIFDYRKKFEG